jgi:hypothetical protein
LVVRGVFENRQHATTAIAVCALPSEEQGAAPRLERLADGRQELSLGRFGRVLADAAARVTIERANACELTLALSGGSLAGDLQKLVPASLHVRTELGEIVVRGTRFAVHADGALEVILLSGRVDVLAPDKTRVQLEPGKVFTRTANRALLVPVTKEHALRVAQLLESAQAPSAAASPATVPSAAARKDPGEVTRVEPKSVRSSADLLAAAEAERRHARLAQARALYRETGMRDDENAEVALLRWTGLELDAGDAAAARDVLALHARRFEKSRLRVEALWLSVRVRQALGDRAGAYAAARQLAASFPNTAQAEAARRLLASP